MPSPWALRVMPSTSASPSGHGEILTQVAGLEALP